MIKMMELIHNDFKIDFMLNMLKDLKENTNIMKQKNILCIFTILACFNTFTYIVYLGVHV